MDEFRRSMGGRSQERVQGLRRILLVPDLLCVSSFYEAITDIYDIYIWRLLIAMRLQG
jgi:hypothetical protein